DGGEQAVSSVEGEHDEPREDDPVAPARAGVGEGTGAAAGPARGADDLEVTHEIAGGCADLGTDGILGDRAEVAVPAAEAVAGGVGEGRVRRGGGESLSHVDAA